VWTNLGGAPLLDIGGGKYFSFVAKIIGPVNAAKLFQRLNGKNNNLMKTIDENELKHRLEKTLERFILSE
jgi:hypothetical protein